MSEDDEDLERRVVRLEETVDRLESKFDALEQSVEHDSVRDSTAQKSNDAETGATTQSSDSSSTPVSVTETDSDTTSRTTLTSKLETISQVKLLGVIGSLAVFLAVVFSVQYAIQNDVLTYLQRIILGLATGTVLAGTGYLLTQKTTNERYGWILTGLGVAVTYVSLYASYGFKAYREAIGLSLPIVTSGLVLIVAVSTVLAVVEHQRVLANESILLGFLAAVLTLGDFPSSVSVLFVCVLTVPVVLLLTQTDWLEIGSLSAVMAFAVLTSVILTTEVALATVLLVLTLLFGLYISITLFETSHSVLSNALVLVTAVPYGVLFMAVFTVYDTTHGVYSSLGWVTASVFFTSSILFHDKLRAQTLVAVTIPRSYSYMAFFAAFIAAVDVDAYYASFAGIALIVTATLLMVEKHIEKYVPAVLIAVTSVKILVFDWNVKGAIETLSLTGVTEPAATVTLTVFTVAMLVLTYHVNTARITFRGIPVVKLYGVVGTAGLFFIPVIQFTGYVISVAWVATALLYVVTGIALNTRFIRGGGLFIFAAAIVKVFIVDMQGLTVFERILSLIGLGVGLLASSYVYSNYLIDNENTQ